MLFKCPECERYTLVITHRLELPPDSKWDEITLQALNCSNCHFESAAVYYESRRGALDSEIWHHTGYHLDIQEMERLVAAMRSCKNPRDKDCLCPAHLSLGMVNEYLAWDGLSQFHVTGTFIMQRG